MSNNKIISEIAIPLIGSDIEVLRNINIHHFGYREFLEDGSSIGFCTHQNWSYLQSKSHITESMASHYKKELIEVKNNNYKYLVRCGETKNDSYFLNILNNWKLWNSLVIYKRESNKICGYYFISLSENNNMINTYLNNLSFIENITSIIKPKIQNLTKNFNKNFYDQLFSAQEAQIIIDNKINSASLNRTDSCKATTKRNAKIYFTPAEKKIIHLLVQKFSNKKIAQILNISLRTIEWHLSNIRLRTLINKRQELVTFLLSYCFKL